MADIYDSTGNIISKSYDISGDLLTMCYDYQGNQLRKSHAVSNNITKSLLLSPNIPTGTQGFACDSITQSIAQLYGGVMYMIDVSSGEFERSNNINLGHGRTGMFAPTKTSSQEYPLLYVSGENYNVNGLYYTYLLEIIYASNTATLNKIYAVPIVEGMFGSLCIDFDNNIVYNVVSTTYYGTTDYMYINAWDMNSLELLEGASYSPTPQEGIYALTTKLSEFQVPFIPENQACTFFDGLLVAISDKALAENKFYQFIDVELQDIYMTIDKYNLMLDGELEGVSFLYNNETEKYDMIVSQRIVSSGESEYHTEYWRYEFN